MAFIVYVCINLFFGINTIISHSVVFLLSQEKATDKVRTLVHLSFVSRKWFCNVGKKKIPLLYPSKEFGLNTTLSLGRVQLEFGIYRWTHDICEFGSRGFQNSF